MMRLLLILLLLIDAEAEMPSVPDEWIEVINILNGEFKKPQTTDLPRLIGLTSSLSGKSFETWDSSDFTKFEVSSIRWSMDPKRYELQPYPILSGSSQEVKRSIQHVFNLLKEYQQSLLLEKQWSSMVDKKIRDLHELYQNYQPENRAEIVAILEELKKCEGSEMGVVRKKANGAVANGNQFLLDHPVKIDSDPVLESVSYFSLMEYLLGAVLVVIIGFLGFHYKYGSETE